MGSHATALYLLLWQDFSLSLLTTDPSSSLLVQQDPVLAFHPASLSFLSWLSITGFFAKSVSDFSPFPFYPATRGPSTSSCCVGILHIWPVFGATCMLTKERMF